MTDFVDRFYGQMTAGEKQHMANKLWRDDSVAAKKVLDIVDDVTKQLCDEIDKKSTPEPVTYMQGQRFLIPGLTKCTYVLASIGDNRFALINIDQGTRAGPCSMVKNSHYITEEEVRKMAPLHSVKAI